MNGMKRNNDKNDGDDDDDNDLLDEDAINNGSDDDNNDNDDDNNLLDDDMDKMYDDEANEEIIKTMKRELEAKPTDYACLMELIGALRRSGELEEVRERREYISKLYTMPPKFWIDWIEDEKTVGTDRDVIKQLFERAVRDFHSPEVYLEYVQWACGVSINFAREKMEEAVIKIGLRADCASLIWNVYLDFEKMILNSMNGKEDEKQRQLVGSLYGRLLRVPHIGLEDTWNEYKAFADGNESDEFRRTFENSAKHIADISEFENRLADATEPDAKLSILMEYIAFEMQTNDPARIQMIFERSLCTVVDSSNVVLWQQYSNWLDTSLKDLWLQYGNWLDTSLKLPQVSVEMYTRAIRHTPCVALWQQFFSALERSNASSEEIDGKWQDARDTITTEEEGLSLYRTYIYLLRRRIAKEGSNDYSVVLEKFDEGATFLAEKFGPYWDSPKAQYRKNHALFLYTVAKQPDKARKIWNDILASGSGHLAAAWIEAANLERFFGSVNNSRKLLYRGINSASDHPYTVFDALIQFEREVGTMEELDKALEKVNAQAARISMRPQKNKSDSDSSRKRKKERNENVEVKKLKKGDIDESEQKSAVSNDELTNGTTEAMIKTPGKTEEKNSEKKQVDGDGFVVPQLPSQLSKMKATSSGNVDLEGSSKKDSTEQHTIFVSNLDFKLPKEKLEEIFPNAKEVRLVYRGMSKLHKGFGYIDFSSAFEAREALKMDRKQIDGRPMYVSEYKPHDKGKHAEFRYSTDMEKNKVFIKNVHYDATEEQLKEIFAAFGTVRSVRIVTHKSGKSKGFAYVEYDSEEDANNAVKYSENLVLLERKLSVAISNPPKRGEQKQQQPSSTFSSSHQRSKIDLVPRALTRTAKVPKSAGDNSGSKGRPEMPDKKNMSNEQFRSFLK